MAIPDKIANYEISEELGRGGMGVVYKGNDPNIQRRVAIKVLQLEGLTPAQANEVKERFLREARAAGNLVHPSIVTIYQAGEESGLNYIAMEFVEGKTLDNIFQPGSPGEPVKALEIAVQVADALEYAHSKGIIHRDIKPANIIVTESGEAKVMDFGIARLEDSTLTREGTVMGSPSYMSPEQVMGGKLDGRSDIFSLAIVLYEILTGERPFPGDTLNTITYRIMRDTPTRPGALIPNLPEGLDDLIMRALEKKPNARYANVGEFKTAMQAILGKISGASLPSQTVPIPKPNAAAVQDDTLKTGMAAKTGEDTAIVNEETPPPAIYTESATPTPPPIRTKISQANSSDVVAPTKSSGSSRTFYIGALVGLLILVAASVSVALYFKKSMGNKNNAGTEDVIQDEQAGDNTDTGESQNEDDSAPVKLVPERYNLWKQADKLLKAGSRTEAIQPLEALTEMDPSDAEAHLMLGMAYMEKQPKKAIEMFKTALSLDRKFSDNQDLHKELISLLDSKYASDTIEIFSGLVGEPGIPALKAAIGSGSDKFKTNIQKSMVGIWEEMLQQDMRDGQTYMNLARGHYVLKNYSKSIRYYRSALGLEKEFAKDSSMVLNMINLLGTKYADDAIEVLALFIGRDALDYLSRAGVEQSNRFKKNVEIAALRIWEEEAKRNPDSAEAHFKLAQSLKNFGKNDQAFSSLKLALDIDTSYVDEDWVISLLKDRLKEDEISPDVEAIIIGPAKDQMKQALKMATGAHDYNERHNAAKLLGKMGERVDEGKIYINDLFGEPDCDKKLASVSWLVNAGDKRAIKELKLVLADRRASRCGKNVFEKAIKDLEEGTPR